MIIVPIMDLKGGNCVYTRSGIEEDCIIEESPLDVVNQWVADGISRIHIIDIDALRTREPENVSTVRAIKNAHPNLIIEIHGGICHDEHILIWLDAGVDYLVLSAKSVLQKDLLEAYCIEYPGKIMISVDLVDGKQINPRLIPRYGTEINDLLENLQNDGVEGVILSNNSQQHIFEYTAKISTKINLPLFLNGNKQRQMELQQLQQLNRKVVQGLILSRDNYNNKPLIEYLKKDTS